MNNNLGRSIEEDIKKLSEENHALLLEIHLLTKKINRQMIWGQVMNLIKIAIIVIPLWYVYNIFNPQLKQVYSIYSSLLGGNSDSTSLKQNYEINQDMLKNLSPEVLNQLKRSGIIK